VADAAPQRLCISTNLVTTGSIIDTTTAAAAVVSSVQW
jgi:hypothetical protein